MTDVFFKCGACGKHLVVDDAGVGVVINCPDCHTALSVPTAVLVFHCPKCSHAIKCTPEMKGEPIDCPSCQAEFQLPGQASQAATARELTAYICPACRAEVQAPLQVGNETSVCPGCGEMVHYRRKLHLRDAGVGAAIAPRRRRVWALAILVIFAGLILLAYLKITGGLR